MVFLIAGLVIFLGVHLLPTAPALRNSISNQLGAGAYQGLFSLLSLAGLVLIIYGFAQRDYVPIWTPPAFMKHIVFLLMLPVFVLLAASMIPSHIRTFTKHPMLLAIKLWAFAHLLANGDLAGMLLFGSLLAYAIFDRISVKRRAALGPLGARTGGIGGDIAAVGIGLAVYAFMLVAGHYWLIGIPLINVPMPGMGS
jgi:uncharacterized membrane protein